ncbi:START domain-containing protein [Galbibacter sp. EGI 63066]|uniref:START domain-containing protein n=1 Tax=Galbibacter sp. EGI 63066 TaxID=2993559 RepID=UPI0022489049|nr:START domain-containing protein [Galbibacter sp. EGI 63066]MCX2678859.1 START domain-containing protein [Galbibacter sp. EGI 63066]
MKLFLILSLHFAVIPAHSQEWSLKRNSNNIQVFTRNLDSTKINEYKAVLIANTTAEKVVEILTDGDKLNTWNHKTPKSKTLKKISDKEIVLWMENDLPWPISDRDNISHLFVSKPDSITYKIDILPGDSSLVEKDQRVIRMDHFQGFWLVRTLDQDSVEVTQQMYGDPKGNIPPWLVNSILIAFPYHSFENLKEILEN